MNEYRIKVTVRNNLLLSAIEQAGFKSQAEFARAVGMDVSSVNSLVAMRNAPLLACGEFSDAAKAIMEGLGAAPSDLWTDEQLTLSLEKNTGESLVSGDAIQALLESHNEAMTLPSPEEDVYAGEMQRLVASVLNHKSFSDRERRFVGFRFDKDMTLDEIAKTFGVTTERVRQIEARVLRKLRHPKHREVLEAA